MWGLSRTPAGTALTVHNAGAGHAKLSALTLVSPSGRSVDVAHGGLIYVLAGGTRHWDIAASDIVPGEKLRVEAYDDQTRHAITVPVVAAP